MRNSEYVELREIATLLELPEDTSFNAIKERLEGLIFMEKSTIEALKSAGVMDMIEFTPEAFIDSDETTRS